MTTSTTADTELKTMAADFFPQTKKMFKSCTFAHLNVHGPREEWEATGDFKSRNQAIEAARMWAMAFRGKVEASVVDGKYRISVKMKV